MPIRQPKPVGGGKNIPAAKPFDKNQKVEISFKLLDLTSNPKFGPHHCADNYVEKLLSRLRALNGLTVNEFRVRKPEWRNHEINFNRTTEPQGFYYLVPDQLRGKEAWQFGVTKSSHGRVHGLLIDNFFYVIWIDPCHQLFEDERNDCGHQN